MDWSVFIIWVFCGFLFCFVYSKRRGWPETANTWEPMENLQSCSDVIDAFEERFAIFPRYILFLDLGFYYGYVLVLCLCVWFL